MPVIYPYFLQSRHSSSYPGSLKTQASIPSAQALISIMMGIPLVTTNLIQHRGQSAISSTTRCEDNTMPHTWPHAPNCPHMTLVRWVDYLPLQAILRLLPGSWHCHLQPALCSKARPLYLDILLGQPGIVSWMTTGSLARCCSDRCKKCSYAKYCRNLSGLRWLH